MTLSNKAMPQIIPVILCGGSGTRLWPASRENHPKQFLPLMDEASLLQNTVTRALRASGASYSSVVCVTLGAMKNAVQKQLTEIDDAAAQHILCEPSARNTAAAIALAARYVAATFGPDAILWVLPSDHHIAREDLLQSAFHKALSAATSGRLATFGIKPTRADTGYGYIQIGDAQADLNGVHAIKHFREKPDAATAQSYVDSGEYMWNSGMFLFSAAAALKEFEIHSVDVLNAVDVAMHTSMTSPSADAYAKIPSYPFDTAIMEKTANRVVVPCNPAWSDVGSWESLWDIRDKDHNNNVIEGKAACHKSEGCLINAQSRLIAVAGLNNIVVVETEDAILVGNKHDSDSMKELVQRLKKSGAREVIDAAPAAPAQPQPWTMIKNLSGPGALQAREITIAPGEEKVFTAQDAELCLYTVLSGAATFSMAGTLKVINAFESTQMGGTYAIVNNGTSDLKMIEVQKGAAEGIFFPAKETRKVA